MDAASWHARWAENRIGFHEGRPNALLVKHVGAMSLASGARVFLPLCGKTRDIGWLLSRGCRVAGAELSGIAIGQLYEELGLEPVREPVGSLVRWRHSNPDLDVFEGDVFELSAHTLGPVDLVYDRAALVALPESVRRRYALHLVEMSGAAPQLLITFEYDQTRMDGPPFSVTADEVRRLYGARYAVQPLETAEVVGGLKGIAATETIWRLASREQADPVSALG